MNPDTDGATSAEETAELRRRCAEDAWPKESRYERLIAAAALASNGAAWFANYVLLGFSRLGLVILGINVVSALAALPWLVSSFSPRPPRWQNAARLGYIGCSTAGIIAVFELNPTHISTQGWGMVAAWTLVGLLIHVPVWSKLAMNLALFAIYLVHLAHVVGQRGAEYATPHQVIALLVCAALAAFVLPWVPHRMEERRFREFVIRQRLEREVRLREQRELELLAEKTRADGAAQEARLAARTAAREARLRTELFANMSHDLRTPMAGILGLVELMRDTPLSEEQAGFVETIRASNQTLLSLLDDVIDFARLEEGKLPLAPVAAPLTETLKRPVDLMRVAAGRKALALHLDLPETLPRYVQLDPARVQQILLNLLGNAVKFTQEGGVTLRARLSMQAGRAGRLRVEIEDTGIGFTAEQKERLFQRFSQADDGIVGRFGGSGLGLSICKSLVELMGGVIGADGAPGRGARFWFEIPTELAPIPSGIDAGVALPSLRVLLAEDNPVNQLVISTMLKKLGQTVSVASDGEQALRMLVKEPYDLAILDMQMHVMDGQEVTRKIRVSSGRVALTHVVALTASATAEEQARFRAAGVDAVYTKPIDMDRLRHLLSKEGAAARARPPGPAPPAPAPPSPVIE